MNAFVFFLCYAYQTYLRRKAAKERARQNDGVEHAGRDNRSGRETRKMALPQFERERKNYTPCEYALGRVEMEPELHTHCECVWDGQFVLIST